MPLCTLNVVLHPLWAVRFEGPAGSKFVKLYSPHFTHDSHVHEYRAGRWGSEQPLAQGAKYKLSIAGWLGGPVPPGIDANCSIVKQRPYAALGAGVYYEWELPVPTRVTPQRLVRIPPTPLIAGSDWTSLPIKPQAVAAMTVLVYQEVDPAGVSVSQNGTPLPWNLIPDRRGFVNLHFWAEMPCRLSNAPARSHSMMAFDALAALLSLNMQALETTWLSQPLPPEDQPDHAAGLVFIEFQSLGERNDRDCDPPATGTRTTPATCGSTGNIFLIEP